MLRDLYQKILKIFPNVQFRFSFTKFLPNYASENAFMAKKLHALENCLNQGNCQPIFRFTKASNRSITIGYFFFKMVRRVNKIATVSML